MQRRTLMEKIWDDHVVHADPRGPELLYVDLHLLHEVTSPQAFAALRRAGRQVRRPDLSLATADHVVPTTGRSVRWADPAAARQVSLLERNCAAAAIPCFGAADARQGVVHVVGPEQGLVQPGMTVVCGDSHTATHGAFGALAFGIGTSEVAHVLATQTLPQVRPRTLAIEIDGQLPAQVSAKDLALAVIGRLGVDGGVGRVIEYRGPVVRRLGMAGRMTLANMTIEAGARAGLIAPDEQTFAYLEGRPFAPRGAAWARAVERWRSFQTDPGARFDETVRIAGGRLAPRITWGTTPAQSCAVGDPIPEPASAPTPAARELAVRALEYMGLEPGMLLTDVPVDCVFIGSCTNGRLEDLRAAARVLDGRRIAGGVRGLVVPGSGAVKAAAEAEGLDRIFTDAGLEWRAPGCSMCLAMNADVLGPGERCASTSNRNFEGRQGPGGRTHLVSPALAAAAAVAGRFADVQEVLR